MPHQWPDVGARNVRGWLMYMHAVALVCGFEASHAFGPRRGESYQYTEIDQKFKLEKFAGPPPP